MYQCSIRFHFSVIDALRRIELLPYIVYWIQKVCLLYFRFDEYNSATLKYHLKISIDIPLHICEIHLFIMSPFLIYIKICIRYMFIQ